MRTTIFIQSRFLFSLLLCGFFLMDISSARAQENPPVPVQVEVRTAQFMNFGSFTAGHSGGTISVDWRGKITTTGDVVKMHLGESPSAALFDVYANPGTLLTILPTPRITLKGSNGGTIYLEIDSFSTGQTFITTAHELNPNEVYIGGTLTIGNPSGNPAGRYDGNFSLTFIHQ